MNGMVESALYKLVRQQQQESIRQYTRQETQDSDYLLYDFQKRSGYYASRLQPVSC